MQAYVRAVLGMKAGYMDDFYNGQKIVAETILSMFMTEEEIVELEKSASAGTLDGQVNQDNSIVPQKEGNNERIYKSGS